ncbi:hypothetical protein [Mucilaginibacter auburnensis]|uniref:DoxX-like protein n=1 Tax=Mucilaginibacter auburnensis TaxID=1457233 RepID=A0A2H9VPX1_9SPHI|nr:hypothetical protein [Mucilaginibacter auburnensis]PJJ80366.1 hypothetical protein CLV57_3516 [Mucilaginibacter auburnensis]
MITKPFSKIALPYFLTGLISAIMLQRIGLRYFYPLIPPPIMNNISIVFFIGVLLDMLFLLPKNFKNHPDPYSMLAFWQDALRYLIALDMCIFGVCKFFGLQFNTPLALLDNPFNTISDSELMWAFFGHSRIYTLLIGGIEIAGGLLVIFRKTRLLGVFVLLPVTLNIFFLDVFYNGIVTSVYIGIEIAGLVYLLWIEYPRLVKIFFTDDDLKRYFFKSKVIRNLVKLSVIVIPFILMAIVEYPQYYPEINGKYVVKQLKVNGKDIAVPSVDSVLTKVYIDKNDIVLEYNKPWKRLIGNYKYNEDNRQLTATWRFPQSARDTLKAQITPATVGGKATLTGKMGKESLNIEIERINNGTR